MISWRLSFSFWLSMRMRVAFILRCRSSSSSPKDLHLSMEYWQVSRMRAPTRPISFAISQQDTGELPYFCSISACSCCTALRCCVTLLMRWWCWRIWSLMNGSSSWLGCLSRMRLLYCRSQQWVSSMSFMFLRRMVQSLLRCDYNQLTSAKYMTIIILSPHHSTQHSTQDCPNNTKTHNSRYCPMIYQLIGILLLGGQYLCYLLCLCVVQFAVSHIYQQSEQSMQASPWQLQQRVLECDLDKLMRDMRSSEDSFLTVLHNILKIMHPNQAAAGLFVNEDICHYRNIISRIRGAHSQLQQEYSAILQRYHQAAAAPESSEVLLKRVVYRLLEIIFNSLSTVTLKIPHLLQDYLRLKIACQKIMQESSSQAYLLFRTITEYEFKKVGRYLELFAELTNLLENGESDAFSRVETSCFIESRMAGKDSNAQTKTSFFSSLKANRIRVKEKQTSKPEIASSEKQKLVFPRRAKALFDSLKDVMELSRQQFLEDHTCYGEHTKEHLYRQLWARNRANHQSIADFQQKKRRIVNKLKAKGPNKEERSERAENQRPEEALHNMEFKPITTTRKSLLLKLKTNEKNPRPLPSELFRKTSKFEDARFRLKSYNRDRNEDKPSPKDDKQAKQQLEEAEELPVGQGNSESLEERLPVLNKRAQSVDQNYKPSDQPTPVRTLSNSLKINEQLRRGKCEKVEMHPVRIKLQLKAMSLLSSVEVGRKLGKYLYF